MVRKALVSLAVGLTFIAGAAVAKPVPGSAEPMLKSGKAWISVTPAGDATFIHGAIDIAAPPQKVWAILVDCNQAKRIISNLMVCKVLDKGPGWDVREQVTKGNLFMADMYNVFRADYSPYSRITFHKTGGNLKAMQGEWRLEPLDGGKGTRVIYENRVAAEVKLPADVVRAGIKADCAKVLVNLRKAVTGS